MDFKILVSKVREKIAMPQPAVETWDHLKQIVQKDSARNKKHDVLFQKLFNLWYAFAEIEGEVFFVQLPHGLNPQVAKTELYAPKE
jgi:hypothetical protein